MSRTYDVSKIISLPSWKAAECSVVASQLIMTYQTVSTELAASGKTLPENFRYAIEDLEPVVRLLDQALQPTVPADSRARRKADQTMDNAWSAFHGWLQATLALPSSRVPGYQELSNLYALLFQDGLNFLKMTYEEEWHATNTRLSSLLPYEATVNNAGGAMYLESLKEAFSAYGVALGITQEALAPTSPLIRPHKLEVETVLRRYVARLIAWPDARVPEAAELVERLIQPLSTWTTSS